MRICHLSMTPVAGACWSWSEAFKEAGYDSWCCCPPGYGDGRLMPRDEDWPPDEREIQMIHNSDLVFCYQGQPYKMPWYPKDKPTVGLYVSQPHHLYRKLEEDGWPWAVIGEYQTRLYPGCEMVPNMIPLKHPLFQVGAKSTERLRVVYSPSNQSLSGWDDKGFTDTQMALSWLGDDAEIQIITGQPFGDCLRAKGRAHLVIDECVTGAYHGNSLQGLAAGAVVLNAADTKSLANLKAFSGADSPFEYAPMPLLEGVLKQWLIRGPQAAIERGALNRSWMEENYQAPKLVEEWFVPLMDAAIRKGKNA